MLAAGAATVVVGILGFRTRAGWTAGAVLTLDAAPVNVHRQVFIAKDTHPYAPNTQADPAIPTYAITWWTSTAA